MRELNAMGDGLRKNNQRFPETNFLLWIESFDQMLSSVFTEANRHERSKSAQFVVGSLPTWVRRGCVVGGDTKHCIFFLSESVKSKTHDWASDERNKLRFLSCTAIVSILHVNSVCEM